jgi:hypothetical protein
MKMYLGPWVLGNTTRILSISLGALLVSSPFSSGQETATTEPAEKEAIGICTNALVAEYGAIELSDISHTHNAGHRSVYANARLASGEIPRFRCLVRHGTNIVGVEVYSGAAWNSADAYRVKSAPEAAVPAETPIPVEPSETDPTFIKPGSGSGPQFKRPKATGQVP